MVVTGTHVREMDLCSSQQRAFDDALGGKNVFVGGDAGGGKSYVVRAVEDAIRDTRDGVILNARDAHWGVSAIPIEGEWEFGYRDAQLMQRATLLVVECEVQRTHRPTDPVATFGGRTRENADPALLDHVLRKVRNPALPFGGLQVLFHYAADWDMAVVARQLEAAGLPGSVITIDDRRGGGVSFD
jgi:hypothetical protein